MVSGLLLADPSEVQSAKTTGSYTVRNRRLCLSGASPISYFPPPLSLFVKISFVYFIISLSFLLYSGLVISIGVQLISFVGAVSFTILLLLIVISTLHSLFFSFAWIRVGHYMVLGALCIGSREIRWVFLVCSGMISIYLYIYIYDLHVACAEGSCQTQVGSFFFVYRV